MCIANEELRLATIARSHAPSVYPKTQLYPQLINGSERTRRWQRPEESTKPKVHRRREYSADQTMFLAVTSAPLATSSRTTSYLPRAALWSGVSLRCKVYTRQREPVVACGGCVHVCGRVSAHDSACANMCMLLRVEAGVVVRARMSVE